MTKKEMIAALITLDQAANFAYTTLGMDSKLAQEIEQLRILIGSKLDEDEEQI